MTAIPKDPWVSVRTYHGLPGDEVISALQKEIRRGKLENACLLAYEMYLTSPEMEAKLWKRLLVIAVEDVGLGAPGAPQLVHTLYQIHKEFDYHALDRPLFAIHAVRYLCEQPKDRSSDELLNWVRNSVEKDQARPEIPDYAIDMHTARGQDMGRGLDHFFHEGARVAPEMEGRNQEYRKRLLGLLGIDE